MFSSHEWLEIWWKRLDEPKARNITIHHTVKSKIFISDFVQLHFTPAPDKARCSCPPFLKFLPAFVLNPVSCWSAHCSHHSSPTLSRVPLEAFLLAPVSPGIILSPSMASTKKMKWVLKLSGCPLTLATKLDLIPSTWHIPKSQTSFYLKSCFSLIHLLTLPTLLSSPNTTLIMSHPCLKPFLPQVASIQRGNSNISTKEQSPAILSYQCGSLQPSSSPFPWSGPSPLTPSPPRCSLGTLGSDDYSLTQVIVSTQECPLHFFFLYIYIFL